MQFKGFRSWVSKELGNMTANHRKDMMIRMDFNELDYLLYHLNISVPERTVCPHNSGFFHTIPFDPLYFSFDGENMLCMVLHVAASKGGGIDTVFSLFLDNQRVFEGAVKRDSEIAGFLGLPVIIRISSGLQRKMDKLMTNNDIGVCRPEIGAYSDGRQKDTCFPEESPKAGRLRDLIGANGNASANCPIKLFGQRQNKRMGLVVANARKLSREKDVIIYDNVFIITHRK